MSGFVKKAKKKAGLLVDKLRPGSRSTSPPAANALLPASSSNRHTYADPPTQPTAAATAGSAIYELLAAARDGSDLCLPLKAALTGVVKIWDICERTAQVNHEYRMLESRLAQLNAATHVYGVKGHLDPDLKLRLESIAHSFGQLVTCVEAKLERGTTRRVLESRNDVGEVKDLLLKISALIEAFLYESTIRVEIAVNEILSRLPTAEENEMKKELERWSATTQSIKSILGPRRVDEASHTAQPKDAGCMPGTRVGLLSKFSKWVKEDIKRIFWLAGMAGTGKTSVALTLCNMLDADPMVVLGGAFFCSRTANVEGRTDVRRILPTLAVLLARQSPKFAVALAAEIRPNSGVVGYEPVGDQIGRLIQRPLAALASETRPVVFVIDALDECANERELAELLTAVATFECVVNVKFILTSRPETHILGSPISDGLQNEILQLHLIEKAEVTKDIRLYIEDGFSKKPLAKPWYSDAEVVALATLSDGLFIFASTMIKYVTEIESVTGRTTRLQKALAAIDQSAVAMGPLDAMYEFVLTRATDTTKVEAEELEETRRNLACILAARAPLSITALAELLQLEADVLRNSLRRLHATVYVPHDDEETGLRTLHASFGDYLFERASASLRISSDLGTEILARGCLQLMSTRLHFNVSQSHSSHEPNPPVKLPKSIRLSLEYACLHWIHHIAGIKEPAAFVQEVDDVIRPNLLFWLEVMSVLGQVRRATAMLIIAVSTLHSTDLSRFLRDANTFVASSREAIARSAPHIYLSALPFAAKDSLIYQTFIPLYTGLVTVETYGIDRHGGRLVMTFVGHEGDVNSATYSSDGRLLASGGSDGTVRIWDTRTGEEAMSPLRSGDGFVHSVAFAPNGRSLASATHNGVVCLWINLTGVATARQLRGHTGTVTSVVFSPNGSLLASASEDETVRLWNVERFQQLAVLNGHTEEVSTLAFSPDGQILASGAYDQTIRLWHTNTRKTAREPLRDPNGAILSISFSPDGMKLASGSSDGSITLWESQTGRHIAVLLGSSGWIRSVQFSPNGQSLVSAADQNNVRLWTLGQGTGEASSAILTGHTHYVSSTTFSPDGQYVASASIDGKICIWDAGTGQVAVQPLEAHSDRVVRAVVSADSSFVVSSCVDQSVCAWDVHSGEKKLEPLLGHTSIVSSPSVAISSDGHLIASATGYTIRLWDPRTGEVKGELLHPCDEMVFALAFSPDTRLLASGTEDYTVRIWDVATKQSSTIGPLLCSSSVYSVAFSPDGKLLATGDRGGVIQLWHATTGQLIREFPPGERAINSVAFSPDGAHIVSSGSKEVAHVWDVGTEQQVLILEGHTREVLSVSYSCDGRLISSGSMDGTARLWDAATGAPIATLHGHGNMVKTVVFTPDGRFLVSCSDDSTIRVWNVEAARSLSSNSENDGVAALATAKLDGGWLLNQSKKLLLWVPEEYRNYVQISPCTMVIGSRRILVKADKTSLYAGESWTACWHENTSSPLAHAQ